MDVCHFPQMPEGMDLLLDCVCTESSLYTGSNCKCILFHAHGQYSTLFSFLMAKCPRDRIGVQFVLKNIPPLESQTSSH